MIDILVPVYNEGENIVPVMELLGREVKMPFRVLICYDRDDDTTLEAVRRIAPKFPVDFIKNEGKGVHAALMTGFRRGQGEAAIVYPADDHHNAGILDAMAAKFREGYDIVAPSRFMKGGCMVGCPWKKAALVRTAAFTLYHVARVPTHDPTNGFRLFSRRVLNEIPVESTKGFTYSIELLVKAHRRGWKICELPSRWFERQTGKSRFRMLDWLPAYLRWYFYAFSTAVGGQEKSASGR